MSILNVNQIQPVGSGQTVTINAANISAGSATLTAGTFSGNLSGNVTGNVSGIITASSGDITLTNGNLVIGTSGKGIDFSATANSSGTMSSELLSDYEEGTWTPTLGGNATYSIQSGKYTKIGRFVFASAVLSVTTLGTGSSSTISGLPFSSNNPGGGNMGGGVYYFDGLAVNVIAPTTYLIQSQAYVTFNSRTTAGTTISSVNVFGNSARVDFSLVYEVS